MNKCASPVLGFLAAVAVVLMAGSVLAQQPARGSAGQPGRLATRTGTVRGGSVGTDFAGPVTDSIKIRRLEGVGRSNVIRTPEYRSTSPGGTKPAQDWVEIKTTFDTGPEWIDEVVFQYYVLTENKKESKTPFSFYQATVKYGDVEKGRNHLSTVYIGPHAIKRFGYPVAVGVEVSVNGKIVDSKSERDPAFGRLAEQWWNDQAVTGRETVAARQGYLLNRKESPFAFVNIDDHEVIR
jgi:hypothetical protein